MDVYSGKRAVGLIVATRKRSGSGPAMRDIAGSRDEAVQFCTRIGCSGRLNHTKDTQTKFVERPKPLRPAFLSSVTNVKKPLQESRKKLSSKTETYSTNSSSVSGESEIQESNASTRSHAKLKLKSIDTESSKAASSNTKVRKVYGQKSGPANQDAQIGSSDSTGRRNIVKKRPTEGERSLSDRGKKITGSSSNEGETRVSSVRTRRSVNPSPVQSANVTPNMPQTEIRWFSAETSSNGSSLNGDCTSSEPLSSMMPAASTDHSIGHFTDRNGSGRYSLDRIANVLLALERIEQDEELMYEQILSLEANSLLGNFNFYDQHRDMRLDIDNMSYEELLVLEEKMGTVSTALSEEELSKRIRVSIFKPLHMKEQRISGNWCLDDTKCSICQEEFIAGDEIGRLGCAHGYHAACINQWLRLKSWCPICKVSIS